MLLYYQLQSLLIVVLGLSPLMWLTAQHYRHTHRRGLLLIMAGLLLIPTVQIMQMIARTHDASEPVDGVVTLIPLPWYFVCETISLVTLVCLTIGLLGELLPSMNTWIDRIFAKLTRPSPGESESL